MGTGGGGEGFKIEFYYNFNEIPMLKRVQWCCDSAGGVEQVTCVGLKMSALASPPTLQTHKHERQPNQPKRKSMRELELLTIGKHRKQELQAR